MKKAFFWSCFFCCLFVFAPGCSKEPIKSTVSGTVTLKGSPLPAGTVLFFSKELDSTSRSTIKDGGKYTFPVPIPVGDYLVCISDPPTPPPGGMGPAEKPIQVNVPAKYRSFDTSELKFTIKPGPNEYNIELE